MNCGYHVKKRPRDKKQNPVLSHTSHTLYLSPHGNQNIRTFILILNIIVTKTKSNPTQYKGILKV